jgi:hypothetical protein
VGDPAALSAERRRGRHFLLVGRWSIPAACPAILAGLRRLEFLLSAPTMLPASFKRRGLKKPARRLPRTAAVPGRYRSLRSQSGGWLDHSRAPSGRAPVATLRWVAAAARSRSAPCLQDIFKINILPVVDSERCLSKRARVVRQAPSWTCRRAQGTSASGSSR